MPKPAHHHYSTHMKKFWIPFLFVGFLIAQLPPPPGYGPYPYSPYYGPGAYPPNTAVVGRPYPYYGNPYPEYSPYYPPEYGYSNPYPYPYAYPDQGIYNDGNTVWVP